MPEAALFSVSDKTGAAEVAKALADRGVAIYATGGTQTFLADRGITAHDVGELTGFPPLSFTVATSGAANAVLTVVFCDVPLVAAIEAAPPALLVSMKFAGAATPATVAITV